MIEVVPETGSTNADLLARLAKGEEIGEGYWLLAERQTGGRGRSGREWLSGGANLHASTVVNLRAGDPPSQTLSLAIGLAVFDHCCGAMFDHSRHRVTLKWPNDVLIEGAKVAGILLERQGGVVVVGVGINLHSAPEIAGRKTTFLSRHNSKYEASPEGAAQALAHSVSAQLGHWRAQSPSDLQRRWLAAAHPVGTPLSVHDHHGEPLSGTFAGLETDGALLLRLPNGSIRAIHTGDVNLEN